VSPCVSGYPNGGKVVMKQCGVCVLLGICRVQNQCFFRVDEIFFHGDDIFFVRESDMNFF